MHVSLFALLLSSSAVPLHADSLRAGTSQPDTAAPTVVGAAAGPLVASRRLGVDGRTAGDTVRAAPVEYSDWYERRLTIHKRASYAMLPLFAFQYAAGRELYDNSSDAPGWAKSGHRIAATGVAALFTVNSVTGVWNLWEGRKDPEGRKWRTAHAVLMLLGDAGFTATGVLAERAERSPDDRSLHKNIALTSVAVSTLGYLMMLPPLRRE
jgi:hypothetical protein